MPIPGINTETLFSLEERSIRSLDGLFFPKSSLDNVIDSYLKPGDTVNPLTLYLYIIYEAKEFAEHVNEAIYVPEDKSI